MIADLLARLDSTKGLRLNQTVIEEVLEEPSMARQEVTSVTQLFGWMDPIIHYLMCGILPKDD